MGSIVGWLSYGTDLTEEPTAIMRLAGEDTDSWVTPRLALSARPRSIRSLRTPGGVVAVGLSGQLQNRGPLGETLRQRSRSVTDDDADLVLHNHLAWGESMPERLDGIFAIAIWDERDQRLTLVRDRFGVEALYYYPLDDGVVFGSDPSALFSHDRVRRQVDLKSMRDIFTFTTPRHTSPWRNLFQVEPGGTVTVTADGVRSRPYWRLATRTHTDDRQATVAHVRERLTTVLRQQLSDMAPCIMLSGGLDSSAMVGIAATQLDGAETLHTFSVDFADPAGGAMDAPFARDVARLVGSDHRRLEFGWRQLAAPDLRRKMIVARGGPMSWGDGDVSLYLAFTEIHRSFDAVLTGDCADAVFGFPPSLQQRAVEARTIAWQETNACEFWAASLRPDVRKALDLPQHRREEYERAVAEVEHLPGADALERRMREINYLDLCWHTRVVLDRRDRIARLTGLNVRVPYCDRELVEYMYNVPWSLKTFDGREKSVLRHAVLDVIPESVAQRSKRGYPLTMDARYAAALQDQGKEILADPYSPVFAIVDQGWLEWAVQAPIPEESPSLRFGLDRALDLYHWLDLYEPELLLD